MYSRCPELKSVPYKHKCTDLIKHTGLDFLKNQSNIKAQINVSTVFFNGKWDGPWISRASGWQTERADCNYLKNNIFGKLFS